MKRREFVTGALGAAATAAYFPTSRASSAPAELRVITRTGQEAVLTRAEVLELADGQTQALLTPTSPRYDAARKVWNAMWDSARPALIARCSYVEDVINAVNFARTHDLLLAVRGGGHSISGKSVCDGGLVIDLSPMRSVIVDPLARTARVAGGCLLSDVDQETQEYGMIVPAGVVAHTGVGGLTLGGGIGVLMRKFGLTIDNLRAVEIVTADGKVRTASADENPDLFWAVRGGGGNFGVVTSFTFNLNVFGPELLGCGLVYPLDQAQEVFDKYFEFTETMPSDMHGFAGMTLSDRREPLVTVGYSWLGSSFSEGERHLEPLRKFGKPVMNVLRPINFVRQQSQGDDHNEHGRVYYIKGRHVNDYDPEMTRLILERWKLAPGRFNTMRIVRFGGAVAEVASDATAWPHRNAMWDLEVGASWADQQYNDEYVQWGRDYWNTLDPFIEESFYVNEIMDEDQGKVATSYESNYPRLVNIKNQYDPKNLFQLNANIKPTV